MKKTKIVCTMGPNTSDRNLLRDMILAGMDVARFNFSHGDHEEHEKRIETLKELRDELDLPIAMGVLAAKQYVTLPDPMPVFAGELALDGSLRPVNGILPMILRAREEGMPAIFIPATGPKGSWWMASPCIQLGIWEKSSTISRDGIPSSLWPRKYWNWKNPRRDWWILPMSRDRKWPNGHWRLLLPEGTMC